MSGHKNDNFTEELSNHQKEKLTELRPELDKVYSVIDTIVKDMESDNSLWKKNKENYEKKIIEENPDLFEHYPAIFKVIFNPNFSSSSMDRLKYMINMARRVKTKDIAEHDASVAVGQRLVDDIVKPQLDNENK